MPCLENLMRKGESSCGCQHKSEGIQPYLAFCASIGRLANKRTWLLHLSGQGQGVVLVGSTSATLD